MTPKQAAKEWVEWNMGLKSKQKNMTHEQVWAEMEKLRPLASKKEVDKLWAKANGINYSDVGISFGHK